MLVVMVAMIMTRFFVLVAFVGMPGLLAGMVMALFMRMIMTGFGCVRLGMIFVLMCMLAFGVLFVFAMVMRLEGAPSRNGSLVSPGASSSSTTFAFFGRASSGLSRKASSPGPTQKTTSAFSSACALDGFNV